jgi:hypothetical protein
MLKESGYPVLAPTKVPASGGKFRTLEGVPVSSQSFLIIFIFLFNNQYTKIKFECNDATAGANNLYRVIQKISLRSRTQRPLWNSIEIRLC